MVKIMIADDQQLIRESLKIILDSDPSFEVVKVVGSGQEVLDSLKTESVDIILMDVRMPNMSGVDCTRIVKKEYPNIKVIILTTFDDDEYIYDALKYGAIICRSVSLKSKSSSCSRLNSEFEFAICEKNCATFPATFGLKQAPPDNTLWIDELNSSKEQPFKR